MPPDWRKIWQETVDNFRRELGEEEAGEPGRGPRLQSMRREVATARGEMKRLEQELTRTRTELENERDAEQACHRREAMARRIGDEETARLAVEYGSRHAERAAILERKVEVLEAERVLRSRELEDMEGALRRISPPDAATAAPEERDTADFGRLEREARERAAQARLEELKRRMR